MEEKYKKTSIFGTFRRTKAKKQPGDGNGMLTLQVNVNPRNSGVFNSTPNLYKIDQNVGKKSVGTGAVAKLCSEYEKNGSPKSNGSTNDFATPPKWDFGSRRASSSTETWTGSMSASKAYPVKKSNTGSTSSLRHFASMMSVMGSLKRSKSIRKFAFGSSMNVSKETPPSSSSQSDTNSLKKKPKPKARNSSAKSEEFLPDLTDSCQDEFVYNTISSIGSDISRGGISNNKNTEPGVISSGSSSESCSVHDTNSLRANSEKSDIMEESDEEFIDKIEKDPEEIERQKTVLLGIKKFNMDPKKGIEFLVDKAILYYTSDDVARFLKDGVGLSKASIGNYLGERADFNEDVLKAFVDLHDFKDVLLVQALRQFLWSFRLPGESQKISRMLDAFADRYCQLNPDMFSTDTCSVLCYSIIMLNTELHNPNVKEKATIDQFIKRNRGIEGGERLDPKFMVSLYNSILYEPFRFPEEDGNDLMLTFFNPDIEGWLYKFGGRPKSWKRLWFILSNNCLYFFKFTTDKTPKGIIPLENILVRVPQDKPGKLYTLILYKDSPDPRVVDYIKTCKTLSDGQTVPKAYATIQLGTQSRKERERWVRSINANHSMSKFYSDLTLKKMKKDKLIDGKKTVQVVRKSQISLPSSALGNEMGEVPVPEAVLLDPTKDPKNFFAQRNLSSISLTANLDHEARPRSRSETILNHLRSRSKSKSPSVSVSTISHPEEDLDATLKAEDIDVTLDLSNCSTLKESDGLIVDQMSPTSPTYVSVDLRTETVTYDKSKMLSMIMEQHNLYDRDSVESNDPSIVEDSHIIDNNILKKESSSSLTTSNDFENSLTLETLPSEVENKPVDSSLLQESNETSVINSLRKFSISSPKAQPSPVAINPNYNNVPKLPEIKIDYAVLKAANSALKPEEVVKPVSNDDIISEFKDATTSQDCQSHSQSVNIPELSDNNSSHSSIEIIDCSSPDVQSKMYPADLVDSCKNASKSNQTVPAMCFDNIYESNV